MLRNLVRREMNLSLDLERGARGMNGGKMLVWDLQANDADEEL